MSSGQTNGAVAAYHFSDTRGGPSRAMKTSVNPTV